MVLCLKVVFLCQIWQIFFMIPIMEMFICFLVLEYLFYELIEQTFPRWEHQNSFINNQLLLFLFFLFKISWMNQLSYIKSFCKAPVKNEKTSNSLHDMILKSLSDSLLLCAMSLHDVSDYGSPSLPIFYSFEQCLSF